MNPWIRRAIIAYVAPRLMAKGREMYAARQRQSGRPVSAQPVRRRGAWR